MARSGLQSEVVLNYMGARWLSTTRANTSTSTCAALARSSARAQASVVAPEVRTSSIRTTRRPCDIGAAFGGDLEGALHIAGALRPRQPDLLLGRPDAPQRLGGQLHAGLARNHPRQRAGLVVAAAPAAPPVQRHRHQHVGLVEQFLPGARHPAAHRAAPDRCGPGISAHGPACARRRHSAPRRGRADRPAGWRWPPSTASPDRDRRQRECRAAGSNGGAMNDSLRPARGADALAIDRLAAGDAQRRQRDVERQPRRCAQARRGSAPARRADGWRAERGGDASASMRPRLAPACGALKALKRHCQMHGAAPAYQPRMALRPDPRTDPVRPRAAARAAGARAARWARRRSCSIASRRTWTSGCSAVTAEICRRGRYLDAGRDCCDGRWPDRFQSVAASAR